MTTPTVLIVEDEMFLALDIERILQDAGYTVAGVASDKQEALTAAAKGVSIAFVDMNLRDGPTGPMIACELARMGAQIVYVTANPAQIDPVAEKAVCVVKKPFREETILQAARYAEAPQNVDQTRLADEGMVWLYS